MELIRETEANIGFSAALFVEDRREMFAALSESMATELLRQQFSCQHAQYLAMCEKPDFNLVKHKDDIIGRLYLDRRAGSYHLVDITLHKAWRNQGFGECLLRKLLNEAESAGLPVTLNVIVNSSAVRLYKRLGFVRTAEGDGVYCPMIRLTPRPNEKNYI